MSNWQNSLGINQAQCVVLETYRDGKRADALERGSRQAFEAQMSLSNDSFLDGLLNFLSDDNGCEDMNVALALVDRTLGELQKIRGKMAAQTD